MPQSFFGWVQFLLQEYGSLFLQGIANTLIIAIIGTILGFLLGLLVGVLRSIPISASDSRLKRVVLRVSNVLLEIYIEVFRGTPMMVQAMVIFYGVLQPMGLGGHKILAAIFIVSINTGAYMAEIVRGGIISVDSGQTEGALSIGMTHWQTMMYVVLPQAIRNIMPSIGNEFVINIKDSSVLNVIAVAELFFMGKSAAGTYLRYFEVFFIIGVIYLVLTFAVTRLLRFIEKKMDGPSSYVVLGSGTFSRAAIEIPKEDA